MPTETDKLISAAEKEIAKVLEKLETDTGMILDQIEVKDIEITTYGDDRPQWLRRVALQMKRLPGTRWSQA